MRLVIVTGMSGAGKTVTLKILEDIGFYCVDNFPILLLDSFMAAAMQPPRTHEQVALGIDIRSGEELPRLEDILKAWKEQRVPCEILFLDAQEEVLVKRYKETRRIHPLAGQERVETGIGRERQRLAFLREQADIIIDTSRLLTRELRDELAQIFVQNKNYHKMSITVLSFGFKYGIPADADFVCDVRFLPNPYYVEALRFHTGKEPAVRDYVYQGGQAEAFLTKLYDMMDFLIPNYIKEGRSQLIIAVGCTGGKHRSVSISEALYKHIGRRTDVRFRLEHRDIERDTRTEV